MKIFSQSWSKDIDTTQLKKIQEGGEGSIFEYEKDFALKIFHSPKVSIGKIRELMDLKVKSTSFCFPLSLIFDEKGFCVGFLMKKVDGEELQTSIFTNIKYYFPAWTRISLKYICLNILDAIKEIHKENVLLGDISGRNILVNNQHDVFFIDTDSYQIGTHTCNVMTTEFTHPDLIGRSSDALWREKKHEYFSIAILIFKVFMLGKNPYAQIGGGSVLENIKKRNFPYPFGIDVSFKSPKGKWEFIWNELPYELRRTFYRSFSLQEEISVDEWRRILLDLEDDEFNFPLIPEASEQNVFDVSTKMGRRDVKKEDLDKMEISTKYNVTVNKIGVLELSTKAVKLLVGDVEEITSSTFRFDLFKRDADLTNTGQYLNSENILNVTDFQQNIMPVIKKKLRVANNLGVDIIFSVATAAYRSAQNYMAILDLIKKECGVNVKILTKKEETLATTFGFSWTKPIKNVDKIENLIFIDQGGGSTEISFIKNESLIFSYTLNLGTYSLSNILFANTNPNTLLVEGLKRNDKYVRDRLNYFFSKEDTKQALAMFSGGEVYCVAVGTAITKATGRKNNASQHGFKLSSSMIEEKIKFLELDLCVDFPVVSDLTGEISRNRRHADLLDNKLAMRLGLPMYKILMDKMRFNDVYVSGTGLWYGVFFQQLEQWRKSQ